MPRTFPPFRAGCLVAVCAAVSCTPLPQRAAEGDAAAMVELGDRYAEGRGMPRDEELAVHWYKKALDQGDSMARERLLAGVRIDVVPALLWRAAEAADAAEAAGWHIRAARLGSLEALDALRRSPAVEATRFLAEEGDPAQMLRLAKRLDKGDGVARDPAEALAWARRSAAAGDGGARRWLAEGGDLESLRVLAGDPQTSDPWRWRCQGARLGDAAALAAVRERIAVLADMEAKLLPQVAQAKEALTQAEAALREDRARCEAQKEARMRDAAGAARAMGAKQHADRVRAIIAERGLAPEEAEQRAVAEEARAADAAANRAAAVWAWEPYDAKSQEIRAGHEAARGRHDDLRGKLDALRIERARLKAESGIGAE